MLKNFKLSGPVIKLFSILLIGYILVILGQSVRHNYQINKRIVDLQTQIAQLEEEKQTLLMKIEYYQTDSFKDLEARRRLNMKKPDEKVVVLPKETITQSIEQQSAEKKVSDKPNYQLWLDYFKN